MAKVQWQYVKRVFHGGTQVERLMLGKNNYEVWPHNFAARESHPYILFGSLSWYTEVSSLYGRSVGDVDVVSRPSDPYGGIIRERAWIVGWINPADRQIYPSWVYRNTYGSYRRYDPNPNLSALLPSPNNQALVAKKQLGPGRIVAQDTANVSMPAEAFTLATVPAIADADYKPWATEDGPFPFWRVHYWDSPVLWRGAAPLPHFIALVVEYGSWGLHADDIGLDWGDGTAEEQVTSDNHLREGMGIFAAGSHQYAAASTYTVSVMYGSPGKRNPLFTFQIVVP